MADRLARDLFFVYQSPPPPGATNEDGDAAEGVTGPGAAAAAAAAGMEGGPPEKSGFGSAAAAGKLTRTFDVGPRAANHRDFLVKEMVRAHVGRVRAVGIGSEAERNRE